MCTVNVNIGPYKMTKYKRKNILLKSHFKSTQTQQHINWSATNRTSTLLFIHVIDTRCAETLMPAWHQRDACAHGSAPQDTHRSTRQHQLQPSEAVWRHFRLRRKARYSQHWCRRLRIQTGCLHSADYPIPPSG